MDIFLGRLGILTVSGGPYKPGDPRPTGYLDAAQWADAQLKAGLKEQRCGLCGLWKFPQELSGEILTNECWDSRGRPVTIRSPVCCSCASKRDRTDHGAKHGTGHESPAGG